MFLSLHPPLLMSQRPPLLTSNIHPFWCLFLIF
jgi:hypothetical protein